MKDAAVKKTLKEMYPNAKIVKEDGYWNVVEDFGDEEETNSYVDMGDYLRHFAVSTVEN